MAEEKVVTDVSQIIRTGKQLRLRPEDIKPSKNNPRRLFDLEPLKDLKENIRLHGVLVPIIVYQLKGQEKYEILDGERRHRCCVELKKEGVKINGEEVDIPANVVTPPDTIGGILYMFNIHNYRDPWDLMPTALSLQLVMEKLDENDTDKLSHLTGLSTSQIERCKTLLSFPKKYQQMSLDPDPKIRIPANFWIEAKPVLTLCKEKLPKLYKKLGSNGILDNLVEKYRSKKIKSVIHFRKIMEAYDVADKAAVLRRLREYIENPKLETRAVFDQFVGDPRRVRGALDACNMFVKQFRKAKVEFSAGKSERTQLIRALKEVKIFAESMLTKLEGGDAPIEEDED